MTENEFKLRWLLHYVNPDLFKLPLIPHGDVDVTFIMRHNHWEEPPDPSLGTYAYPMFRIYDSDGNIIYSTTNTNGEYTATVPLIVGKRYKFVEIRSAPQCFLADDYEFIVTPDTTEITIMHEVKYYLLRLCIDNNYNFGYYDENPDVLGGAYDYEFNSASIVGRIGIEIYKHNKDGGDTLQGKYFPAIDAWGHGHSKRIAIGLTPFSQFYPPISPDISTPGDNTRIWAIGGGVFINASTSYNYYGDGTIPTLRQCFLAQRNIPIKFEPYTPQGIAIYIESFSYGWAEDSNGNVIGQGVWGCGTTYEDVYRLIEIAREEMRVASGGATSVSDSEDYEMLLGTLVSLNPQPETIDIYTGAGVYKTIPFAEYTDGMTYATYSDIISNHDYIRASTSDWIKMFGGEYEYNPNYT